MLIDPEQFQGFYGRLVEPLLHKFTSRIVAVDGQAVKASRRSGEEPVNTSLPSMTLKMELL